MRVTCKYCGGAHPAFECRKKSAGGERIGAQAVHGFSGGAAVRLGIPAVSNKPPVDTNPESSVETLDSSIHGTPFTPSAGTGEDKDRQPKFDKVAYQRDYMRKWRAARGKPA